MGWVVDSPEQAKLLMQLQLDFNADIDTPRRGTYRVVATVTRHVERIVPCGPDAVVVRPSSSDDRDGLDPSRLPSHTCQPSGCHFYHVLHPLSLVL